MGFICLRARNPLPFLIVRGKATLLCALIEIPVLSPASTTHCYPLTVRERNPFPQAAQPVAGLSHSSSLDSISCFSCGESWNPASSSRCGSNSPELSTQDTLLAKHTAGLHKAPDLGGDDLLESSIIRRAQSPHPLEMQWFLSVPDLLMSSAISSLVFLLLHVKLLITPGVAQGSNSPFLMCLNSLL